MKRRLIFTLAVAAFGLPAFAQSAPQANSAQPSTTGIIDRLKDPDQRKQLEQALDILQKAANDQAQDAKSGDHKTVGDALDKGLDMAKETVVYLAGKIEQVAPQLWRVLVIQQYVKGATLLIQPIGFLFLVWIYRRLLLKWWRPSPSDDNPEERLIDPGGADEIPWPTHKGWRGTLTIAVPLVAIIVGGIWFYTAFTNAAGYFINPNYYALKDIIQLVRNPAGF